MRGPALPGFRSARRNAIGTPTTKSPAIRRIRAFIESAFFRPAPQTLQKSPGGHVRRNDADDREDASNRGRDAPPLGGCERRAPDEENDAATERAEILGDGLFLLG